MTLAFSRSPLPRVPLTVLGLLALFARPAPSLAGEGPGALGENPPFEQVRQRSKDSGRPILLDFYRMGCSWCEKQARETYATSEVSAAFESVVRARYDGERGEGKALADRYHIPGFPTVVVIDSDGAEVDRITGFKAPKEFLPEVQRILRGEGTLKALREKFADNPEDLKTGLLLAKKLVRSGSDDAAALLDRLGEQAKGAEPEVEAGVCLVQGGALLTRDQRDAALACFVRVLKDFPGTEAAVTAAISVGTLLLKDDPERALDLIRSTRAAARGGRPSVELEQVVSALHLSAAEKAVLRQAEAAGDDPQALNDVAWACYSHGLVLEAAAGWARKAVELSKRDPAILDTLAHVLFELGQVDEAVRLEDEAASKATNAGHIARFQEALAKFRAVQEHRKKAPAPAR
jgi:tetratricopeptide (TPR) repeat protein